MLTKIISTVLLTQKKNKKKLWPKLTYNIYLSSKMKCCNKILIKLIFRNKGSFRFKPSLGLTLYENQVYYYYLTLFQKRYYCNC